VATWRAPLKPSRLAYFCSPSETDLYFRVADNAAELPHLRQAELQPIPSIWGHRAGSPDSNPEDFAFVRNAVASWLAH